MALVSSISISHGDALWRCQFDKLADRPSLAGSWSRNGTRVVPRVVPAFIRTAVLGFVGDFVKAAQHR